MASKTKKKANLLSYLRESKEELNKVTWPTQKETVRYSIIVIVASLAIAVYFGVIDYLLNLGLEALLSL
ncbi:preprotein translocase subunit SecE [Candidatus Uhrbacteria bacterium]|jgi:preprotein translocase subunit SecE|nr:preprotein translocase subunit SecE [Candidatus Uhrbacteria bacterium]